LGFFNLCPNRQNEGGSRLLLLGNSGLGGLGGLARASLALDDGFDNTDGNGLAHITDGKSTKRGVHSEGLHTHGLGGLEDGHSGIARLDGLGVLLKDGTRTSVNLGQEL